jgi:hypothetical protein
MCRNIILPAVFESGDYIGYIKQIIFIICTPMWEGSDRLGARTTHTHNHTHNSTEKQMGQYNTLYKT